MMDAQALCPSIAAADRCERRDAKIEPLARRPRFEKGKDEGPEQQVKQDDGASVRRQSSVHGTSQLAVGREHCLDGGNACFVIMWA